MYSNNYYMYCVLTVFIHTCTCTCIIYIIYQIVQETSQSILEKIPAPIPLEPVIEKYPVKYEESMNTVLIQEVCTLHYIKNIYM